MEIGTGTDKLGSENSERVHGNQKALKSSKIKGTEIVDEKLEEK